MEVGPFGIAAPNVKVRNLAGVPNEKRAAAFEYAEQVDDREATLDAVAGLEDEPARGGGLDRLLRHGHCPSAQQAHRHMCVPPHTAMAWPVM
ncbi:MAG: hypothetical protein F4089_01240 [Gammaproteobacteria bacterium]|nr:hypothetical protein [Gammaproteobacteria bacterium]